MSNYKTSRQTFLHLVNIDYVCNVQHTGIKQNERVRKEAALMIEGTSGIGKATDNALLEGGAMRIYQSKCSISS